MKATILLGTLKSEGLSNTETLCEFLVERMERKGIRGEIIKLVDHRIPPGTCTDMGDSDDWPSVLDQVLDAEMLIIATPIWWSNQSSLIQRVIERLDELHDEVMAGKGSRLDGKVGGMVMTGGSDGAEQVIGHLGNFFNGIGVVIPPYATLTVLWERHAKSESPTREELMQKYHSDYTETADKMVSQLLKYASR